MKMGTIYDYDFFDEVPFYKKSCCDGGGGRSEEQKEIDERQDETINKEIERSTGVDETQSQEIADITKKIEELDRPPIYETDEE